MPEWAQAQAGRPVDIGGAMVTQQDRIRQLAYDMSPEVRAAERIERRQSAEAGYAAEIADRAMRIEAGQSPRPLSEGASMYILQQGKSSEAEEFRKNTEELRGLRQELKALGTSLRTRAARSDIDARIAEKSARQLALIEAARSASERSQ